MSTVVCRLPHGLIVPLPGSPLKKVVLYYGINEGVEAAFDEWLQAHASLPIVKNRDIFIVPQAICDRLARNVWK